MAVAIASDLTKDIAGEALFRGVSFKLERRDRLTLAGANGSGKTTLLRMLAGETSIDGGELSLGKGVRIALHDQRPPRDRDVTLADYVFGGCQELLALEAQLSELEQAMADGASDTATFDRYSRAQAQLEHAGGYGWRDGVQATLRGLGFTPDQLERRLDTFSGGELTRASLARALAGDPDLLLLDEPTNHLDIASLEWLESYLNNLDAAVILVAHDRWFLEAVGTAVLEIERGRGRFFAGTWHAWRKEKALRELSLGRKIEREQAEIARLERFVDRFRAGTRARQAQARQKRLDKTRDAAHKHEGDLDLLAGGRKTLEGFQFKAPERSGRVVFELEGASLTIGDRVLLRDSELWLERGEHVTLIGPNGSGKTTLLNALLGESELAEGKLRRGHNVKIGLLSQHAEGLSEAGSVIDATQQATGLTPNKARALLGQFLFSGKEAEKSVSTLSGGERQRLSLAILVHSGANLLILDEPTNHLDIESQEALEDALSSFTGTVLLITHDRALLDAVGTRTIAIEDQRLRSYVGGWPGYLRAREERRLADVREADSGGARELESDRGSSSSESSSTGSRATTQPHSSLGVHRKEKHVSGTRQSGDGLSKNRRRQIEKLESEIATAENELKQLEDELADPSAWSNTEITAESTSRHTAAKERVKALYERWEEFST